MWTHSPKLFLAEQVRAMERTAMASGIAEFELMRRAGQSAFAWMQVHWPEARSILVVCGPGNNGGDGLVFATCAQRAGRAVRVFASAPALTGTSAFAAQTEYLKNGGKIEDFSNLRKSLIDCDVVIDAMLGIGINRAASGLLLEAIHAINRSGKKILALDVPSGVDADRGAALGESVQADATVSFIAHKRGLHTGVGAAHAGAVFLADLDLPSEIREQANEVALVQDLDELKLCLPKRSRDSHKFQHGHVLMIGGNHGMSGAIRLAGSAALRAGAGLISVVTRQAHAPLIGLHQAELMAHGVESNRDIDGLLERASVIAIGPGLGRDDWAIAMLKAALEHAAASGKIIVLDADALALIASAHRNVPLNAILTPHPGEAAALLGCRSADVQADRFAALTKMIEKRQANVVLKGNGSLIGAPNQITRVCPCGNPGMATAGMGDVLTGVIAAFAAQGMNAFDAACMGVLAHAQAGDLAARRGERGLLASDVIHALREVVNP